MPEKEGIMETDVDALMSLLKTKKKISIKDAAKELGVKSSVVEEWARYFEEEGLVKINYKFTTPFIEWQEGKEEKKKGTTLKTKKEMLKTPKAKRSLEPKKEEPEEEPKQGLAAKAKSLLKRKSETPAKTEDVSKLMTQAHTSIAKGEFLKAKKTYEELYDTFNRVPVKFLKKLGQIEDDLIKLNNEVVVKIENKMQEEMTAKQGAILKLLKQAYNELKNKDFDKAVSTYKKIKNIYKELPSGFFEEKITLTKKVLAFYENLNNFRNKLAVNTLNEKSSTIKKQLTAAKTALKTRNIDEASMAYSLAREAYAALPEGFFEEKVVLQQNLLEVHQQIVDAKKLYSLTDAQSKLKSIRDALAEIKQLLKKKEIVIAVQKYSEIKTLYSEMPKGFLKNEHTIQNEILKTYREITTAKNNLALSAIQTGRKKIEAYLKKGKKCISKKDPDLAFQYYKESVESYNTLPKGFDKTKIEVRNMIYDTYFEIVSHADMVTLGELQGYAKEKYFSLLKLIVNAYEVVSTGRFNLLPQIYKSIYLVYQELPLSLVSQKTKLKEEVRNIYLMYKLYLLMENLQEAQELGNYSTVQSILPKINTMGEEVIDKVPNSTPLVNYIKSRLAAPRVKVSDHEKLQLPAPSTDKNEVDELMIKAMNYFTIKNYPKALAYLNQVLKTNPGYGPAIAMTKEINLDKKGRGTISLSKADEKVAAAVVKLEELDYSGAVAEAETALKIEPDNEEAFLIIQKAKTALRQG